MPRRPKPPAEPPAAAPAIHPAARALRRAPAALAGLAVLALAGALAGWWQGWWAPPTRHDPFAPLVLADAPNWVTGYKLRRLEHDAPRCSAVLQQVEAFHTTPVADRGQPDGATGNGGEPGPGCGWRNAVRVAGGTRLAVGAPFTLACPAAVSLALWERHALQPAAQRHLGRPLVRIEHLGSYACRNVNHAPSGRLSEHASANALDVAAFGFAGGGRASVLRDWAATDADGFTPQAAFLRDAHDGACRFFHGVLGPAYNAAHRDHLHLDRGRWGACR